jgi:hypothetical protein
MSELLAPNGKPSKLTPEQYKLVRTPEFKAWFGDWENDPENSSKVIDRETKEPLIVYHGTNAEFTIFDTDEDSTNRKGGTWNAEYPDGYIFMISDKKKANYYGKKIIPLFVNMVYPTIKKVKKGESLVLPFDDEGLAYEGDAIVTDGIDYVVGTQDEFAVKIADGTNTTFDGRNPDIRYRLGGETKNKIMEKQIKMEFGDTYAKGGLTFSKWINDDSWQEQFQEWIEDGNVSKNSDGSYSTQDAQYTNSLRNMYALKKYFYNEFIKGQYDSYAGGGFLDDKNLVAKAIEYITGSAIDIDSIQFEANRIAFRYKGQTRFTDISQKLIEDTISMHRKSLEMRGRYAGGGEVQYETKRIINEAKNFKKDTHFAIHKPTNSIVFTWDYKGYDKEELNSSKDDYFYIDIKDNVSGNLDKYVKSDFAIVERKNLEKRGIDLNDYLVFIGQKYDKEESVSKFNDDNSSFIYYHEKQGNFIVPKGQVYAWLYDEADGVADKLQSEKYDYVFYPLTSQSMAWQTGYIPPLKRIWTKKFQKEHKGSEHLLGVIKAYLLKDGKELYIDMMSVNPKHKKEGIMTFMINQLRELYDLSQDQITFSELTKEGEKFVGKKTFGEGGNS